jgi:hypothetical protein
MSSRLCVTILLIASVAAVGCGLLPTDRPPTDNPYGASFSPDPTQSRWSRLLWGTRWVPEAPSQHPWRGAPNDDRRGGRNGGLGSDSPQNP